jgi:hypothetical protein
MIYLLVLLAILGAAAVGGALLTVRHYEHMRAEFRAEEDQLAQEQELYASWALMKRPPGGQQPSAPDRDD